MLAIRRPWGQGVYYTSRARGLRSAARRRRNVRDTIILTFNVALCVSSMCVLIAAGYLTIYRPDAVKECRPLWFRWGMHCYRVFPKRTYAECVSQCAVFYRSTPAYLPEEAPLQAFFWIGDNTQFWTGLERENASTPWHWPNGERWTGNPKAWGLRNPQDQGRRHCTADCHGLYAEEEDRNYYCLCSYEAAPLL